MRALPAFVLLCVLAPFAAAEDVAVPEKSEQVFAENGWQIQLHSRIVPGTEMHRAQSFHNVFYCGKLGAAKARIVWEESTTGTHFHPLRIAPDGTVVGTVYSNKLLFIGPDDAPGKPGDGFAVTVPNQKPKREMVILHASAAGLIVHPNDLNTSVPVYFVPLDKQKPLSEKAIELCTREANEMHRSRTGFQTSDDWIVWDSGSYEVAPGKFRKRVADTGKLSDLGIDGGLIVSRRWAVEDKKAIHEILVTDLKTGAPQARHPLSADSHIVTLHAGVVYIVNPIPFKTGEREQRAELLAFAIAKPGEQLLKTTAPYVNGVRMKLRIEPKGFLLDGIAVDWAVPVKK